MSYETILVEHEGAADWLTLNRLCVEIDGFSLHALVRCGADDRQALEQLCRYITRPALANLRGSRRQRHRIGSDRDAQATGGADHGGHQFNRDRGAGGVDVGYR